MGDPASVASKSQSTVWRRPEAAGSVPSSLGSATGASSSDQCESDPCVYVDMEGSFLCLK
eukprot:4235486-Pleurochrysis_carterae.AAC.1